MADIDLSIDTSVHGAPPLGREFVWDSVNTAYVTPASAYTAGSRSIQFQVPASSGHIQMDSFRLTGLLTIEDNAGANITDMGMALSELPIENMIGKIAVEVNSTPIQDDLETNGYPYGAFIRRAITGSDDMAHTKHGEPLMLTGSAVSIAPPTVPELAHNGTVITPTTRTELYNAIAEEIGASATNFNGAAVGTLCHSIRQVFAAGDLRNILLEAAIGSEATPTTSLPAPDGTPITQDMVVEAFDLIRNAFNDSFNTVSNTHPQLNFPQVAYTQLNPPSYWTDYSAGRITATVNNIAREIRKTLQAWANAYYITSGLRVGLVDDDNEVSRDMVTFSKGGAYPRPAIVEAGVTIKAASVMGEGGANCTDPLKSASLRARMKGAQKPNWVSYSLQGPAFAAGYLPPNTPLRITIELNTSIGRNSVVDEAHAGNWPLQVTFRGQPRVYYTSKQMADGARKAFTEMLVERPLRFEEVMVRNTSFLAPVNTTTTQSGLVSGVRPSYICVQIIPDSAYQGHPALSAFGSGPFAQYYERTDQSLVSAPIALPTAMSLQWGATKLEPELDQPQGEHFAYWYDRYVDCCINQQQPPLSFHTWMNSPIYCWNLQGAGLVGMYSPDPDDVSSLTMNTTLRDATAAPGGSNYLDFATTQRVIVTTLTPYVWSVDVGRNVTKPF
ncbi:TPA_asm: hypothetical protein [Monosiga MELD virus 1]|nr:TPA_asm: hypothetical protein [Monosiga MELD virus 1]